MSANQDGGYEVVAISSPGPEVPVLKAAGIRHIAVPMTSYSHVPDKPAISCDTYICVQYW